MDLVKLPPGSLALSASPVSSGPSSYAVAAGDKQLSLPPGVNIDKAHITVSKHRFIRRE